MEMQQEHAPQSSNANPSDVNHPDLGKNFDTAVFETVCANRLRALVACILDPKDTSVSKEVNIDPPQLDSNAMTILEKRYLIKDPLTQQAIETPVQMFARVALKLALVDLSYYAKKATSNVDSYHALHQTLNHFRRYYLVMRNGWFIPAGRTLANESSSVPNCIVLHPKDSMESIFEVLKEAALLQKAGCGLGFPLHLLRPTGTKTLASGGESSGPVSFLHVYNTAFGVIKQQNRHGANMAVMRVDHPDILEFVHCKGTEGSIRNFNISVGLTHEFMERVESNDPRPWRPRFDGVEYPLRRIEREITLYTRYKITDVEMTATQLFQEIIECAWKNGEPGCVFLDTVNDSNPLPALGPIHSSNPCVTADTWIETEHGPRLVKDLVGKAVKLVVPTTGTVAKTSAQGFFSTGVNEVFEVTTEDGFSVRATANHRFMTHEKKWVQVDKLSIGSKLLVSSKSASKVVSAKRAAYRDWYEATVCSIKSIGSHEVFDVTVEHVDHCYESNGFVSHNCGEQFLHDGDVCNLGAIVLSNMVDEHGNLVEYRLKIAVANGVRMLDNVIDTFDIPVKRVQNTALGTRRSGLGVMGFAEYLLQRGIAYDSEEALKEIDIVMSIVKNTAVETTRVLAKEKGVFPEWANSIYALQDDRRRNAFVTSVAPTGTISMIVPGTTGGIEPVFMYAYVKKNILGGAALSYGCHPLLEDALKKRGLYTDRIVQRICKEGTIAHIDDIPPNLRHIFKCAHDISPEAHVRVQARFQKYVDNAISKTCNFPNSATRQDILDTYVRAWKLGCKGLTVYRDGSRYEQVLESHSDHHAKETAKKEEMEQRLKKLDNSFDQVLLPEKRVWKPESPPPVPAGVDQEQQQQQQQTASDPVPAPVFKRYRPAAPDTDKNCPDCKTEANVRKTEGCVTCVACGWSKCS